ncbi:MAG: MerR family transcriptional regulator [Candidatus Lokiarchaeota archaeon]|nr:MerR family transcriptional regulator [Candidatus Lokiarchaeota archaeon]
MNNGGLNKKKHFVFRSGDYYQLAIHEYYNASDVGKKISALLNKKESRLKVPDFSYRIINHWEQKGLISPDRDTEKGWRRFSIIGAIWLQIIGKLRRFGFPLEKMLEVKHNLTMPEWTDEDKTMFPLFEYYVVMALFKKVPVYLLIFENGEAEPVTHKEMRASMKYMALDDVIMISINNILQKLYPNKDLKPDFETSVELSEEELEILFAIRMRDFETITIRTKDGKLERYEFTESIKNERHIKKILEEEDFQDIEIKKANGKIVKIKRTTKRKFSK